jgi:hypothetical protein
LKKSNQKTSALEPVLLEMPAPQDKSFLVTFLQKSNCLFLLTFSRVAAAL